MIKKILIILFLSMHSAFASSFKIKFISDFFSATSTDLANNSNTLSNGVQNNYNIDLNLESAMNASLVCSNTNNYSQLSNQHLTCSMGTDSNNIKITIPVILAYDISGNLQIDVVAMAQPTINDPLLNVKIGSTTLNSNYSIISDISDLYSSSGTLKSVGYGGVSPDKNANISFEVPFRGLMFRNNRSTNIKMFILIKSI